MSVSAFFHEPARALGDEVDAKDEWHGWDESRAELETPRDGPCVLGGKVWVSIRVDKSECMSDGRDLP